MVVENSIVLISTHDRDAVVSGGQDFLFLHQWLGLRLGLGKKVDLQGGGVSTGRFCS